MMQPPSPVPIDIGRELVAFAGQLPQRGPLNNPIPVLARTDPAPRLGAITSRESAAAQWLDSQGNVVFQPPGPVPTRPRTPGGPAFVVVHASTASFGQDAAIGAVALVTWWADKREVLRQTIEAWQDPAAWHRWVAGMASRGLTGVQVPREAADPTSARDYLVTLAADLGRANSWNPTQTAALLATMRATRPAATVVDTVAILKTTGPPKEWPGASTWYEVADELARTAGYAATGESLRLWVRSASTAVDYWVSEIAPKMEQWAIDLRDQVLAPLKWGALGLGLTTGIMGGLLAGGVVAYVFGEQIAAKGVQAYYTGVRAREKAKGKKAKGKG